MFVVGSKVKVFCKLGLQEELQWNTVQYAGRSQYYHKWEMNSQKGTVHPKGIKLFYELTANARPLFILNHFDKLSNVLRAAFKSLIPYEIKVEPDFNQGVIYIWDGALTLSPCVILEEHHNAFEEVLGWELSEWQTYTSQDSSETWDKKVFEEISFEKTAIGCVKHVWDAFQDGYWQAVFESSSTSTNEEWPEEIPF